MIFELAPTELAPTWELGLVLFILGTLIIFVGEYLRYKRKNKTYTIKREENKQNGNK